MNLAIVVQTCDRYQFVWEQWAKCFQGTFVPKDLPVYFVTEQIKNIHIKFPSNIYNLRIGPGEWSDRLMRTLEILHNDFIFYMQEDMFPKILLHKWHFELFIGILETFQFDALQISPNCEYYSLEEINSNQILSIKQFSNESNYLISHQPRLWRRDFLYKSLIPHESPWVHEIEGTKRIRLKNPCIGFIEWNWYNHMIRRGQWIHT